MTTTPAPDGAPARAPGAAPGAAPDGAPVGGPGGLPAGALADVVRRALAEDAPWGDVTTEALVPVAATARAVLRSRQAGVLAGVGAVAEAMAQAAALVGDTGGSDGGGRAAVRVELHRRDGDAIAPGDLVATVEGSAHAVLRAERIALNLVQHLSGIATTTARFVEAVEGTGARIVDTRKTTPGLRALERHAVRCGGGHNHRWSLSDAVLVKDNHLAVLVAASAGTGGGTGGTGTGGDGGAGAITEGLRAIRSRVPHTTVVEVEVDGLDQLDAVLAGGVDVVMLDNFALADLVTGVARIRATAPGVLVEASGGVRLETVRAIAETGVDLISVGGLTQASPALDVGLDVELAAALDAGTSAGPGAPVRPQRWATA